MDAAIRLRRAHQALIGEALGLSTFWPRTTVEEMRLLGFEVEVAKAKVDSVNQHPIQDLNPASTTFGQARFMWGRDGWGTVKL
jgi:hypothetical protein